jgi:hypothetical protein
MSERVSVNSFIFNSIVFIGTFGMSIKYYLSKSKIDTRRKLKKLIEYENKKSYDIFFDNITNKLPTEIKNINNNTFLDIQNELKSIKHIIESNTVRINKLEMNIPEINTPEVSYFENKRDISLL